MTDQVNGKKMEDIDDGTLMGMSIMMESELHKRELIKGKSVPSKKGIMALLETIMDVVKK